MAGSDLYRKFKASHCTLLVVHVHVPAGKSLLARMRECAGGKKMLPYWFGTAYPGSGKEKLGLSVLVARTKRQRIDLTFQWSLAERDPPASFGRYADLANCMKDTVRESVEASVMAVFVYKGKRFVSLFKPIQVVDPVPLFDEIVGVAGVKKDASGKPLYRMGLSFDEKELNHFVSFVHPFDLSEDSVKQILNKARNISALALVPK